MPLILLTGAAGFIGSHVACSMIGRGDEVVAIDNMNDYYDPVRKESNLNEIRSSDTASNFTFIEGDIRDGRLIERLFANHDFDVVVHLAAMAGVRESINHPALYYDVNVNGTLALLEACARHKTTKFILASTSSVYGHTTQIPFVETDPCNQPLAPYSASKRAAELLAYTYFHTYGISTFVLRFFTVYGPRGRPDMMAFKIAESIYSGREVPLHNNGQMYRDWTYIDDIVAGVVAAADRCDGYQVINLGRGAPVLLRDFVALIEDRIGKRANLYAAEMPKVDVPYTYADVRKAARLIDYDPRIEITEGVNKFVDWFEGATSTSGG